MEVYLKLACNSSYLVFVVTPYAYQPQFSEQKVWCTN